MTENVNHCPCCRQPMPKEELPKLETVEDFVREYAKADEFATRLDEAAKDAKRKRETIEMQVIEKYTMEGMTSVRIAGMGSFVLTSMTRASIKEDAKAQALALFKEHFPDLVTETVNAQTLSGFVGRSQKDGIDLPEALMNCLNIFKKQYLSWKK